MRQWTSGGIRRAMAAIGCGFNRSAQRFILYRQREDVANAAEAKDLLHGSPEGIDVESLAKRRIIGDDSPPVCLDASLRTPSGFWLGAFPSILHLHAIPPIGFGAIQCGVRSADDAL